MYIFILWSLVALPYFLTIAGFIFLVTRDKPSSKKKFPFIILTLGLIFIFTFINSWIYPLKTLLPFNKTLILKNAKDDSINSILTDKSSDITKTILIAKTKMKIEESKKIDSSERATSDLADYIGTYSVTPNCDPLSYCDLIEPGDKFKIIKKYYQEYVGTFNSDHTFYVVKDEEGRELNIIDFMMDNFEKPVYDDGKIFKQTNKASEVQMLLLKQFMEALNSSNPSDIKKIIEIIISPKANIRTLEAIAVEIAKSKQSVVREPVLLQTILRSKKFDGDSVMMIVSSINYETLIKVFESPDSDREVLQAITYSLVYSKKPNDRLVEILQLFVNSPKTNNDSVQYLFNWIRFSKAKIDRIEEFVFKVIESPKAVGDVLNQIIFYIRDSRTSVIEMGKMFQKIIDSEKSDSTNLTNIAYEIKHSKAYFPEVDNLLQNIINSPKANHNTLTVVEETVQQFRPQIREAGKMLKQIDSLKKLK